MIIVLKPNVTPEQKDHIIQKIIIGGLAPHIMQGVERVVIAVIGDDRKLPKESLASLPGVEEVIRILSPYKLVSREFQKEDTVVDVNGIKIGDKKIVVMAGPCSVETREGTLSIAQEVQVAGAVILRGGAFKPRTSPYSFQGLGEEGLEYLSEARAKTGLIVITEMMDPRDMPLMLKYTDIIQIGARNMQNFRLLSEVGKCRKPVMLKRGLSATIQEFLLSAEYIFAAGNHQVILCERGIRTFETATRNTLDLSAVCVIKQLSHLPVIVDPSHAVGKAEFVPALARAAVAVGADGVMIEVHSNPAEAYCDGEQALLPVQFKELMVSLRKIATAVGREM